MLSRNEVILAKIESTYGSDSSPSGTDAIAVTNLIQANPAEAARFAERNVIRGGSIGKSAPLFGGSLFGLQFDVEVKGAGSLGVAPEWGVLLESCGFDETVVAVTSVEYVPTSTFGAGTSCTIYYWQDGVRYRLTGCRGNVSFKGTVGEVMVLSFTFVGKKTAGDPTDTALPTPTLDSTTPPVFMSASFLTLDAYAPAFTELTFDMGNTVTPGANANAANGYGEVRISERDVRGTIDPEMTLVATQDWIDDWEQGTLQNLTATLGTAGGNRITINMPQVRYIEPSFDDREGVRTISLGFKAQESGSLNDEISILLD
jgi:hypothetical protein